MVLLLLAVPFVMPLIWMAFSALRPAGELFKTPYHWLPSRFTLENFRASWQLLNFPRLLLNSIFVSILTSTGVTLLSSLIGYAFAHIPARGKNPLFALILATAVLPPTVLLLPQFIIFSKLGWMDSYLPLIVPAFFGNAFYIFFFRQYFRGLPKDLFESARLDGCNPLDAYWRIALPLSRPGLAAVFIFSFIGAWNDFLYPLVYLTSPEKFTLSLGLSQFDLLYASDIQSLMAGSLLALTPVIILFFLFQRSLEESLLG